MKSDGDRRNTGIELELQNVFDTMKTALGESELDSIMQNILSKDQQGYAKLGSKTPSIKKKPGGDLLGTPSNVKSISNTSKEGKIMIEEMKKVMYLCQLSMKNLILINIFEKRASVAIYNIQFY